MSNTEFVRNEAYFSNLLRRLDQSKFRRSFHLRKKELAWLQEKGMEQALTDARYFIKTRLADAFPKNDGKQTPMKNHPVFIAQHATGCCCRGCLEKWHGIPKGRELSSFEQEYIVQVIGSWLQKELKPNAAKMMKEPDNPSLPARSEDRQKD